MFRGANKINLDNKGRLAIPTEYRGDIEKRCGGRLVVTVNHTREKCLWLYPMDEWKIAEQKLVNLSSFEPEHQMMKRFLIGYASAVDMDRTGRILVSAELREFAALQKTLYLVGQGNKFEIWDESLWKDKCLQWVKNKPEAGAITPELAQISL